jgi:hypothetical protein
VVLVCACLYLVDAHSKRKTLVYEEAAALAARQHKVMTAVALRADRFIISRCRPQMKLVAMHSQRMQAIANAQTRSGQNTQARGRQQREAGAASQKPAPVPAPAPAPQPSSDPSYAIPVAQDSPPHPNARASSEAGEAGAVPVRSQLYPVAAELEAVALPEPVEKIYAVQQVPVRRTVKQSFRHSATSSTNATPADAPAAPSRQASALPESVMEYQTRMFMQMQNRVLPSRTPSVIAPSASAAPLKTSKPSTSALSV